MNTTERLLTRPEIEARFQISRSTIYRLMRFGEFPVPVRIGRRAIRWLEPEIETWFSQRPKATGTGPGTGPRAKSNKRK